MPCMPRPDAGFRRHLPVLLVALVVVASRPGAGICRERPVLPVNCTPVTTEPSRRVFFYDSSGDEIELMAFRDQLIERGAYHVNLFPPSHIVCMLPESVSARELSMGSTIVAVEERELDASRSAGGIPRLELLKRSYDLATRMVSTDKKPFMEQSGAGFRTMHQDTVIVIPPEKIAGSEAVREEPDLPSAGTARRFNQNSEFMAGNIVINLIFPESRGSMENWTDERLSDALVGAIAALLTFQESFPHASMNFIIRSYESAYSYYEPIYNQIELHSRWINDVIKWIDPKYDSPYEDAYVIVHRFNRDILNYYRADWIFTEFIVSAEHAYLHRFNNADYIAYSLLGGPYLVCPFPAGEVYFSWDESYRLSAYLQHEIGHIFWALDEDLYAQSDCHNRSGYLDRENCFKIDAIIMGVPVNTCEPPFGCVMTYPEWYAGIICHCTAGQMGIEDADENGVPDVFDSAPTIEFEGGFAETLVTDTFTVRGIAKSIPVPNMNKHQDQNYLIDYASPLKDAVLDINGFGNLYLLPEDGRWDSLEEMLVIPLTDLSVGLTSVEIRVRNKAGYMSDTIVKKIFRAGLVYSLYTTQPTNEGIALSWFMIGETFNAQFDLYRIVTVDGRTDTTMIAGCLEPSGKPENQFTPYAYFDSDVEPTRMYGYFVRGTYELAIHGGEPQIFVTDSKTFKATAIIPIGRTALVSTLAPNPFRTVTFFTVRVPRSYENDGLAAVSPGSGDPGRPRGLSREVPTEVEIKVYDVQGRYVATILKDAFYGAMRTLDWAGTSDNNEQVPNGIYFLKFVVGGITEVKKVTVLR